MTQPSPAAQASRPARGVPQPPPARPCPNCGTRVDDQFCPHCGQRNAERLVSVRRIARDTLDDQLSVNGALPRTLAALLFRPGFLTREFVAGRIARYVPPFRLYLLASVLFFVAISGVVDADQLWRRAQPGLREWQARHPGEQAKVVDLQFDTVSSPRWTRPLARGILRQQDKVNALGPEEGLRVQLRSFQTNAPRAAFLLVPAFAGVLKLMYLRRRRLYVEHFVFALHVQSFAFLVAACAILTRAWLPLRNSVLAVLLLGYLLWAMKRVYAQGWPRTLAKYAAVLVAYGTVLGATIVALTVVSLFTL